MEEQAKWLLTRIEGLNAYTRFPSRLRLMDSRLADYEKDDVFGMNDRLEAIKLSYPGGKTAIDLGGNSGFFSLSLIDLGLIESSTVYDLNRNALQVGAAMASMMGVSERIEFVEKEITIEFIRELRPVDTVICLNLIHHAGALFDVEEVAARGWQDYAEEWMSELQRLCSIAIIGVGFKGSKPANWDVPKQNRAFLFKKLAEKHGWSVLYDANVNDIHTLGVDKANGIRTQKPESTALLHSVYKKYCRRILRGIGVRSAEKQISKREKYHIYILG